MEGGVKCVEGQSWFLQSLKSVIKGSGYLLTPLSLVGEE